MSILNQTNNFPNNGLGSSPRLAQVAADAVSWVRRLGVATSLTVGIAAGAASWAMPALALQVQLSPKNPQLGDTMSVMIRLDKPANNNASPTVKMNQKTYQTFAVGPNRYRALLPSTPLDRPGTWKIEVAGEGQVRNLAVQVRDRDFPTQSIWLPPGKDGDVSDYEFDIVDAFKKLQTPQKFWNGAFLRPNAGEITTIYGVRRYYNGKFAEDYYHRGVDYAGAYGSAVVAPAAGRVALVGREADGFVIHGNCIGIDHGQGVTTIYLHLSNIKVKEGDMVKPGQVIGAVGNSGASTGPHLHWGLYVHALSVDPVPWRYQGFE
ncbi:M23 family metallopeptidase [Microcoleus sp. FACHB-68]|nr:M23 family metallopeptidase [Microcoleus sp. FACHB-68]